jgi:hypothetical protein
MDIRERIETVKVQLHLPELLPVKGDMGAHPIKGRLQTFQL